jgi:hypothetical protein
VVVPFMVRYLATKEGRVGVEMRILKGGAAMVKGWVGEAVRKMLLWWLVEIAMPLAGLT